MTKLADRPSRKPQDEVAALRALKHIGVTVGSERWPTPEDVIAGSKEAQANILHKARSQLVRKYRENPAAWPDGIHSKSDPWYKPEEWDDQGKWIAPYKAPWLVPDETTSAQAPAAKQEAPTETEKPSPAEIAAAIKTVLPRKPEKPVTENAPQTVTENQPSVTINSSVTINAVTENPIPVTPVTVNPGRGRPPSGTALSQAERARRYREAQKAKTTLTQTSSAA